MRINFEGCEPFPGAVFHCALCSILLKWSMLNTTQPAWLKDVQTLTSPEIEQIEASIRAGKLTEVQAKPLLLAAGLRAAGQALAAPQGGQAPSMDSVPRR